ncbi:MAG: hypothetical protein APF76_13990 [Desulfitibacter sp. BRH_c19]|nr:MAG: hypothetical protein APF76_13990 [Desulfitibacter sp. BRH_c19]
MKVSLKVLVLTFILAFVFNVNPVYSAQVHRIQPGETLHTIAQQYGISINELVSQNGYLRDQNLVAVNQVLIVPTKDSSQSSIGNTYEVQPGDSLYLISQKLGVTMAKVAEENKLENWDYLYIGQILKFPAKEAPKQEAPKQQVYKQTAPEPIAQYTISELAKMFSENFYLRGPAGGAKVALTFDDGPDGKYTGQVLDVLKKYGALATFFLIGEKSIRFSEVVDRIDREGHVIGNHSWSHPDLSKVGIERLNFEIMETERVLEKITGRNTALIRPPYGAVSKEAIEYMMDLNYKAVNWSVDSVDWRDRDVDQILINTLPSVRDGGILLFHTAGGEGQSLAATVAALSEVIYTLKVQGYEFVTVDELLSIPAYK